MKANRIINRHSLYVLITLYVSAVGFLRSFLFMRWLDMGELGMISLMQTVMMFISLFQFGLINGGYRIFALDKTDQQRAINNVLFSYFALLGGLLILFWLTLVITGIELVMNNRLMLAALICGFFALINNWLTNTLIGKRLIRDINIINLISATLSLSVIPLIIWLGMTGAVLVIVIQPLTFVVITLIKHKDLRPNAWNFDVSQVKYILSFGFIPFLCGIFVQANLQVERWSIAKVLGPEALGEFYLVFLYTTLFVLAPLALQNLFFPKAIYAYENDQMKSFKELLKKHVLLLTSYVIVVVVLTLVAMPFFVNLFFPQHGPYTEYVYYVIPGLIALVFCDPFSIILNATVRLKPIFYAGIIALIVNAGLIAGTIHEDLFDLKNMAIIKSITYTIPFLIYLFYIIKNHRAIFKTGHVKKWIK